MSSSCVVEEEEDILLLGDEEEERDGGWGGQGEQGGDEQLRRRHEDGGRMDAMVDELAAAAAASASDDGGVQGGGFFGVGVRGLDVGMVEMLGSKRLRTVEDDGEELGRRIGDDFEMCSGMPKSLSSNGSDREQEEQSDGTKSSKRLKLQSDSFKKDREEWSDGAICALLDSYTEKYTQLNKGSLRGKHWEEVASAVSVRCSGLKSAKTIEQCKNKVDSLKKRHKVERNRMEAYGIATSQWPWYSKVEEIVGSFPRQGLSAEDNLRSIDKIQIGTPRLKKTNQRQPGSCAAHSTTMAFTKKNGSWQRVLLKVSGGALAGDGTQNIDPKLTMSIAREVSSIAHIGVEVAIIVGGGNFFRGANWVGSGGLDRASADHIGMMATIMNAIFLQASLEHFGVPTRVQTAFRMAEVAEPYIRRRAIRHLEKGRVVIFAAGTGNPFFTTDTAAALRAAEINAEVLLKATNVDGVYDCDPKKNPGANCLDHVSYHDAAVKDLSVMDLTAITLCQENSIPVVIFNLNKPGNILKAISGERVGTLIDHTGSNI
ncbi:hypothetical protein O6H91_14G014900 [Diphasiastrum complanatum]|uniref:Uncharacterized protein n=1 Tax=Diphasiastrum complanatum TaxID=34168 RepID=A0ACC2BLQ1_DIPCM|nr:hypothetical protein O6H91_14G014900 [Diphasiastrum complanatum]